MMFKKKSSYVFLICVLLFSIIFIDFIVFKFSAENHTRYVPAVRLLGVLARLGNSDAQLNLAVRHDAGNDVPKDFKAAFKWYQKAAERGNAIAQNKLGELYEQGQDSNGLGVQRDIAESFKWYRKSADQGYPVAQYSLGWMYNSGLGAPQNFRQVIQWTRKAADQGYADAQNNLGWRYLFGKRIPQDFDAAEYWFSKAAKQGHVTSRYYLGVIQNTEEVINQLRISAEQGAVEAQYLLGWKYFIGKHVPQDLKMAATWFHKAAEQQHHTSQYYLGLMSEAGKGMPKDVNEAAKWYRLAAELGNGDAQLKLENKLRQWD